MTLYEHCNNAYIQLIAFDPQLLIPAETVEKPQKSVFIASKCLILL